MLRRIMGLHLKLMYSVIVNGNWGAWGDWASCTVTCDGGSKMRSRTCDSPSPMGGDHCDVDGSQAEETTNCADEACPTTTTTTTSTSTSTESTTPSTPSTESTTPTTPSTPTTTGWYINLINRSRIIGFFKIVDQ